MQTTCTTFTFSAGLFVYGPPKTGKSRLIFGSEGGDGFAASALDSIFQKIAFDHTKEYFIRASLFEVSDSFMRNLLAPPLTGIQDQVEWPLPGC